MNTPTKFPKNPSKRATRTGARLLAGFLSAGLALWAPASEAASPPSDAASKALRGDIRGDGSAPAQALAAGEKGLLAQCKVVAIHASKKAPGKSAARVPSALAAFKRELSDDQFAAFKSFHLLEQKSSAVQAAKRSALAFRSGYVVGLKLVKKQGARLKVHVDLGKKGGRSLVDLDYWMRSGGLLMLVGGSYQDGKVIFATRCQS